MSVVRRSDNSDIYIYSIDENRYMCDPNTGLHDKEVLLKSKLDVLKHAMLHKIKGDLVPMKLVCKHLMINT